MEVEVEVEVTVEVGVEVEECRVEDEVGLGSSCPWLGERREVRVARAAR